MTEICHELELAQRITRLVSDNPDLQLYGMIDGITDEDALEQFFLLAPEADYEPLFLNTEYESCLPQSPYIFALTDVSEPFFQEWGMWAERRVIWWLSFHSLQTQLQHWQSLIQVLTPENDLSVFRFWDSRVLARYLAHCSERERQQLLAPCTTVFTPQAKRYWDIWANPNTALTLELKPCPWWQVRPQHLTGFDSVFAHIVADEIEDSLWRSDSAALQNIHPNLLPSIIMTGMQQASAIGLSSDEALMLFIRCQLHLGGIFWREHPVFALHMTQTIDDNEFKKLVEQAISANIESTPT